MKVKPKTWGLTILAVGAIALTGVITNNVYANSDIPSKLESVTNETVPPDILEGFNHPDKISTKDGMFEKDTKSIQAAGDFSQDEVVYDASKTTDKTKAIIQYDATYIKEENAE
ncbi:MULTISPECIES: hypothetical protein [unclassified Paenibacillus]|uniref:hypothetical protein n=1 Tax=unclassified Paenibacillus TaxID=185978 RepID=UPI001EECAA97|nr:MULTISPECIES: hypothetical protein [unclassified Paenibacillus]